MSVLLETSKGDIVIDLFADRTPNAAKNFLKLCKVKYYHNNLFYNVQKDFIIETGDPTGTGKGGESIYGLLYGDQAKYFEDEIREDLKFDRAGLVAMANGGRANHNGSQFFITTRGDDLEYMNEKFTIFGEVAEGMDVVQTINNAYCDKDNRPYQIIRIRSAVVLDDPFPDPAALATKIPDRSPTLHDMDPALLQGRLGEDEEVGVPNADTRTEAEIEEELRKKQAKSQAEVLEMIGDLPDADVRPPENILFVCKLNPVTSDEDLELIFSRFGPIVSCEVVRDQKTGESLQYAFVEFDSPEACEQAYFKMDNVLIDDRRIKVDWSQSVAKFNGKGGWTLHDPSAAVGQGLRTGSQYGSGGGGVAPHGVAPQRGGGGSMEMVFDHGPVKRSSSGGGGGGGPKPKKRRWDQDHGDEGRERRSGDRERERGRERERSRERGRDRRGDDYRRHGSDRSRDHRRHRSSSRERHGRSRHR